MRSDLVQILQKLIATKRHKFDYIIIETTGLADPAPVAQTFFVDELLQQHLSLDAIVTVVDAKHVQQHLDDKKPDGVENEVTQLVHCLAYSLLMCHINSVLTPPRQTERASAQSVEQLAFADVVVINKTDLVTEEEKASLLQRIKVMYCCITVL